MSRNDDRTGVPQSPVAAFAAPSQLSWVTPTEYVELPSEGRYYPSSHPLHGKDVVEIRHMTAKEEDILTSKTLLVKNLAIDKMIESVLVDKSIKVGSLLLGDKNAILVASRISGYGAAYTTETQCPACMNSSKNTFDLSQFKPKKIDDELLSAYKVVIEGDCFTAPLPVSKHEIKVRFLTSKDENWLSKQQEMNKKNSVGSSIVTNQLKKAVISVGGVTDKNQINNFIDNMPAMDSIFFRKINKAVSPSLDMEVASSCESCGHVTHKEVPIRAEFFWPDSTI